MKGEEVVVAGYKLECPVCKGNKFWHRKTQLNTQGATLFGFDWANKSADNYVCERCSYMLWFHPKN